MDKSTPQPQSRPVPNESSSGPGVVAETGKTLAIGGVAGVAATKVATAGMSFYGFTSSGIAAGSWAAAWQSAIGNVVAGSQFAALQSTGATGGLSILGPVGLGAAAVAGTTYAGVTYLWPTIKPLIWANDDKGKDGAPLDKCASDQHCKINEIPGVAVADECMLKI